MLNDEDAIRTIIRLIGDDPERPELLRTPTKVVDFYKSYFNYGEFDSTSFLASRELNSYSEQIIELDSIAFISFCEHHIVPIDGECFISYIPGNYISGIGSLVKVVQHFARRLQIQERMTKQIAHMIKELLEPKWVQVKISASHKCLACTTIGGSPQTRARLRTTYSIGLPRSDLEC